MFLNDVIAAILVFQNKETAAMLVFQSNLGGAELFTSTSLPLPLDQKKRERTQN